MAEILARFKKEMGVLLPYFSTFATSLTSISGAVALYINDITSISGQYTDLKTYTSGLWAAKEAEE